MTERAVGSENAGRRGAAPPVVAVIALAAVVYLAGNGAVALWDRDEPRYAQTSRQMLASGDWVVPRLYDEPRTAKPPLVYWLQAACMAALGDNTFAARLPSAAAMVLTLCFFGAAVRRIAGPRRASWAVLVLASSVMVLISAKASTTDSVLLLWLTIGQACLYAIWRGRGTWGVWLTLGVAVGLAGLTKGPPALGVHATTLLVLWGLGRTLPARRRARRPRAPRAGPTVVKGVALIALVAAISAPWLYLIEQRSPGFVRTALMHDVLRRAAQPLEGHKGPPGYHAAAIWGFFLPWSLFLPLALALAWKRRHLPQLRFALAAFVGPWVMFELVRTKLPHYLLPTYPWLALLVGDALVRCLRGQHRDLAARAFFGALTVWAVVLALAALAPLALSVKFRDAVPRAAVLGAAGLAYVATVLVRFRRGAPSRGLAAMGLGVLAVWLVAWTLYLPRAQYLRLSVRVADALRRHGATGPGQVQMLDYKEPSLAFYQGGTIREHPATRLTAQVLDAAAPWLVITRGVWDRSDAAARARLEVVDEQRGLAYAGGRVVDVMVVKSRDAGANADGRSTP
jgi:4-amino-4-deoxy-L-arabinose transferase-like glycosyltransferase